MISLDEIQMVVNKERKDVYGEVYTDIYLIAEMLQNIDINIWTDINTNFYDPNCGKGYFLFFIYEILMGNGSKYSGYENIEGLKNIIKDKNEREKHIIENMLYGTDIQQDNIDFCNKLFKCEDYKTNFLCKDYLKFDVKDFGTEMKNYIGNPPFQDVMSDGSRKAKNHNLWRPIIEKSYNEVSEGGILSFVCPSSWMSLSNSNKNMFNIIKNNEVIDINIDECSKYFKGVGNNFSYFTLIKNGNPKSTNITCSYKGKIYKTKSIIDIDCLPLLVTNNSISILKKFIFKDHKRFNIKFDSYLHAYTKKRLLTDKKDDNHKYKIYHTLNIIKWSEIPHHNQNEWKILIPRSTYYYKLFIDNECGTTQSMGYLVCENEESSIKTKNILLSKLYRYVMSITRWGNWTSQDILYKLPEIDINEEWDDEKIFKYFDLSEEEIEEVNNIIK
jgi:hypothetical protein